MAVLHITSGHREVTQKQPLIFRGRGACVTEEDLGCSPGGAWLLLNAWQQLFCVPCHRLQHGTKP